MNDLISLKKKSEFSPTPAQLTAMEHQGSDLLISAGAGSGKTATLTDRIVKRICEKGMDISRMLVVTFTNDAANELKTRITKKLAKRLKDEPGNRHLSAQLVKVTSADISTIHSFCLKCIRPYFDRLGLDSDFRIGETNELEIIQREAMNEVIDGFYESESIDPDFLLVSDCYSSYTDEGALCEALLDLYNKKICSCAKGVDLLLEVPDEKSEFLQTPYGEVLLTRVRRLVKHFSRPVQDLFEEICSDRDSNKKYFNCFEELDAILKRLDNALKAPTYMLLKSIFNDFRGERVLGGKQPTPTVDTAYLNYIKDDLIPELKDLRDNYFYSTPEAISSTFVQNKRICAAIYKVLKAYEEAYRLKKQRYSLCDFNDLERYTVALFYDGNGQISEIAKRISLEYDELYIDEYQDVNSLQDKIFTAISRNNRFMVGDIKQSIYSFRAAEPTLFSGYRDAFLPYDSCDGADGCGRTIFMSDNFRCDKSVIDTANHISDYMFLNTQGFNYVSGDRLKHSKIYKDEISPKNTEICIIDSSVNKDLDTDIDPQAEFVAKEIRGLLDNGALPDKRKIEPCHIAILLRKTAGSIEKYIDALNRYNIPNEYVQEISFFEKPHVLLMMCVLNSIDNPSKDVYLAGAMQSHLWGFSLEELVEIKSSCPKDYCLYSALKEYPDTLHLKEKIDMLLERLDNYRANIRRLGAHEAISYVINETGFLLSCNKDERGDIMTLYNLAREYENGSYKGLYSFLRYVDDIASQKGFTEKVTSDPQNSVKIVTMHKSKGLEYEICFLCDTEKRFSTQGYTAPILFHKDLGACGYVSRPGGIVKYNNLLRKCTALAIKNAELEEAMRVLYVALTRARSKLYITAKMTKQVEKRDKHARLYSETDEYSIYSKSSHIDIILGACPFPLDFVDLRIIGDENGTQKNVNSERQNNSDIGGETQELAKILKSRFEHEYKYDYLKKIPSKLSISTLYPEVLDSEENEEYTRKHYSVDSLPQFLGKDKEASAAERGTATHVFLQFCDFENLKKHGVECELNRLIDCSYISKSVGEIVNRQHIEAFISSPLLEELLKAKRVIREFRFNIMLPASEFSADALLKDEKVLVQGVTDCIYETQKGELILVDYKTDRVSEENYVTELTRRHKTQLSYYKRACEMMFECKISRVLIYSVPLARTVEIT